MSRRAAAKVALGGALVVAGLARSGFAASLDDYPGNGEPPLVVDAGWLTAAMADPGRRVLALDCSGLRRYRKGHLPGAAHVWWRDTIERNDPVFGKVVQPDHFTDQTDRIEVLRGFGVDGGRHVVVYDDAGGRWAARLVWFLRFLGFDRASLLDGGLAAWRSNGGAIESGEVQPDGNVEPLVQPRTGYYLTTEEVVAARAEANVVLVDARTVKERGDDVNGTVPLGQIPGSVHLPWTDLAGVDPGRLPPAAELAARLEAEGLSPDRRIVVYARFGVEAALSWLVMKAMGLPEVVIYDGSWAEWATTPGLPVEGIS